MRILCFWSRRFSTKYNQGKKLMKNDFRPSSSFGKMDPQTRRALLFSLSAPTNPVPGAVLSYVLREASRRDILQWISQGWIEQVGNDYVLTERGNAAIHEVPYDCPPESYFPAEFRPSKVKR